MHDKPLKHSVSSVNI